MKKVIMCMCLILIMLCLGSCGKNAATENVEIQIGESQRFSEEEIQDAVNLVKKNFNLTDCTLTKLWYDEEASGQIEEGYLHNGKGSINGVKPENVIVIFSEFQVGKSRENEIFEPGATYSDYNWTLIRNDKKSKWTIDDQGY